MDPRNPRESRPRDPSAAGEAGPLGRVLRGAARVFSAEAISIPAGLATVAFLTRAFGPGHYGLYSLVIVLVVGVAGVMAGMLGRTAVKLVSDADDWRPVGAAFLRLHVGFGLAGVVVFWIAAEPIAALWNEPDLAPWLRIFSWELVVYGATRAHRDVLVGLGRFRAVARIGAIFWIARLVLVIGFVQLGMGVPGALLGIIGATLIELFLCRAVVRPPLFLRSPTTSAQIRNVGLPLMLASVFLTVFNRVDLLAYKTLGASAADAGFYGAAQSLAMGPGLVALALSPVLLATLGGERRAGRSDRARRLARDSLRIAIAILPIGTAGAGAAPALVALVFGPDFAAASPVATLLILGESFWLVLTIAIAILVAADRGRWVLGASGVILVVALAGYVTAIPRLGALGAALVTAAVSAIAALTVVSHAAAAWKMKMPMATLVRSGALAVTTFALARCFASSGVRVVAELAVLCAAVPPAYWLLGELDARERGLVLAGLRRRHEPGPGRSA